MALGLQIGTAGAQAQDLTELSIEDLMDIEVTSVSLRPERASDAAAAIFVLTNDDIRRAGVTNVPDALRLAPGVEVAQINASNWAISIRGSNGRFSNKLLVLIDGRSIYTPLFSGVVWADNQVFLEDIERIEVIRGPGATLWGANAVNGVINIITRPAQETQGSFARISGGNNGFAMAEARQGVMLDENSALRLYAQGMTVGSGQIKTGQDAEDAWHSKLVGFRSDTSITEGNFLLEGDYQENHSGDLVDVASLTPPFGSTEENDIENSGGYVMGRWTQQFAGFGDISLQSWLDHRKYDDTRFNERRTTVDLQLQHSFDLDSDNAIVWGLGYRRVADEIGSSFTATITPASRTTELWSGFVQNTITLIDDELDLVVGTKIEHNDYTGTEVQPNVRMLWRPSEGHTLWGAVSRAVRTPSRVENDIRANVSTIPPFSPGNATPFPVLVSFFGSDQTRSEKLTAYELGYRVQPAQWLSLDTAAFYNTYSDLASATSGTPFFVATPVPHVVQPITIGNDESMQTFGFETVATVQATSDWRLQGTYSLLKVDGSPAQGQSPQQQASLRSLYNVTPDVSWDADLRYVDSLRSLGVNGYLQLDTRIAWRPMDGVELSLTGRNLLGGSHFEFGDGDLILTKAAAVERSVFFSLAVRF